MQNSVHKLAVTKTLSFILTTMFVVAMVYVSNVSSVHAGFPYFSTSVNVTSPKPPEVRKYDPGQDMQFTGQFSWAYCGNAGNFRVYGRTSRPVPVSQNHADFGTWSEITSNTGRKTYTNAFTAPTRPGVYKFKYELEFGTACVGIRGANCAGFTLISNMQQKISAPRGRGATVSIGSVNTYRRTGVVTFEVRDPNPPAVCPPNQIPIMRNGARVCVPQTLTVSCTATATQVRPGETVSFAADSNAPATFTWYEGAGTDGAVIGGPETGTRSVISRTFTEPGQYQVTAFAQNASGVGMCMRGVRVVGEDEEVEDEVEVFDEFGNVVHNDGTRTTPDGTTLGIDPTAGPAGIVFTLDPTLTNTTCGATWTTQNVSACYLVKYGNRGTATEIDLSGSEQVPPATYRVECIGLSDGRISSSEERICRQNLNIRES